MKRVPLFLLLCLLCMIQNGCFLKSVHPLVSEEEAILVEGLEGIWESEDHRWTFINDFEKFPHLNKYLRERAELDIELEEEEEENSGLMNRFAILFENLEDSSSNVVLFVGLVTELDNSYFLDLSLLEAGMMLNLSSFIDNHFFPVHTFSKISIHDNQLDIEFFKSSFISDLISSNRVRIKHEKTDDSILITASTSELKKFVEKYAHETEAFEKPLELSFKGFVHE